MFLKNVEHFEITSFDKWLMKIAYGWMSITIIFNFEVLIRLIDFQIVPDLYFKFALLNLGTSILLVLITHRLNYIRKEV